jgi:phosphomannomutase
LILLQVVSESGKAVSELASELSPYAKGSETNFEVEDKKKIMDKIKEKYSDGEQDFLDGVTVSYNDWWFNLRPSNTEPVLRLTIEAEREDLLEEKQKELKEIILE